MSTPASHVESSPVAVSASGATYQFPVSFAQRRLWFAHQLEPQSPLYNMPFTLHLTGELDRRALVRTLSEIIRRHEILRTTFVARQGEPMQEVHEPQPVQVPQVDLSELAPWEGNEIARVLRQQEFERPFNLEEGPLVRPRLVRLAPTEQQLILLVHHIVSDGWSEGVMVNELRVLYEAFHHGRPSPLRELQIQYADYAIWEREWLQGNVLEDQLNYWRKKLAGMPMLELPKDRPRPERPSNRGEALRFLLSRELTGKARSLAQDHGATLFMVLLAGFQLLLSRYSGQKDIAVATLTANRNTRETEDLIGFFVNTLVLRTDLEGDLSFRALLARVQANTLEGYEHQEMPFEKLSEELRPDRVRGGVPFVQAGIALQNMPSRDLQLPGLQIRSLSTEYQYSFVDVGISMSEDEDGLAGMLMYSTDLFERRTMQRFVKHFERLLEEAVADPDQPISDLRLLSDEEWRQLVVDFNRNPGNASQPGRLVHELFEDRAAANPKAIAAVFEDAQLAYGDLNLRANQLAHHLIRLGVGAETRVGLCIERDLEMLVALLGVLKAGAAYVPVDPLHPVERLEFILKDAEVAALVTTSAWLDKVSFIARNVICMDTAAEIAHETTANPGRRCRSMNPAYIIYTSGSTGIPKGVVVTHGGLTNVIVDSIKILQVEPQSRVSQLASLTFDASVAEILLTLCAGASICIVPPNRLVSIPELMGALQRGGVTVLGCVPSILGLIDPRDLPGLKTVIVGGESCPKETAARWLGQRRFLNAYAPTEATIYSTLSECLPDECAAGLPFGRPIANARMYILDESLNPVPVSVVGELCIGGAGVARGYWRRPELTAEQFIPDPFSDQPSSRLYRTGDLGRFRPDGKIDFLGRIDDQVKIRGHRIELGEIETVLHQAPDVSNCAVIVREDQPGDKRLVAYVVMNSERPMKPSILRGYLREKLPAYMVPVAFVRMKEWPLTPNGKTDRRALPAPDVAGEDNYVAPRDPLEEILAGIWEDVLAVKRVGIFDNFFELGGHSLLAMQIVSRVRSAGFKLPLAEVFASPTVAQLAEMIRRPDSSKTALAPPAIQRRPTNAPVPLTFAQQQIWFLSHLERGEEIHLIPLVLRLRGDLRADVLRNAFNEIIRRHEILRTGFPAPGGHPVQVIAPAAEVPWTQVDVTAIAPEQRERHTQELVDVEVAKHFDLEQGPLFRVAVYKLGPQDFVFSLTVHHIICDAVSFQVFLREVIALYAAFLRGEESPLPQLQLQYADVAVWENSWFNHDVLEQHLNYWRTQLQDSNPVLELAGDFPRPPVQSFRASHQKVMITGEVSVRLQQIAREHDATEFMSLLAIMNVWLFRYSGQHDILIGTPVSNRTQVETEGLVGFFINTLVFRTRIAPESSFLDLLAQVRTTALEAYNHRAMPFEKIVRALNLPRDASRSPLFQVLFNNVQAREGEIELEGIEISEFGSHLARTQFDLQIAMSTSSDGMEVVCTYSLDLFRSSRIAAMLESFVQLAELVTANPSARIAELVEQLQSFEFKEAVRSKREDVSQQLRRLNSARRQSIPTGPS
jgi:amino acid adenylation domain-containing protein